MSSVSYGLYFLTLPLVSVMRVIYTSKGMSKKFGVRVIYRKIRYFERERERELSSGIWQYQNNLRALTTAPLFCFGQLLFKGMFSCTVSDRCVLLLSRLTGGFTKLPTINSTLHANVFIRRFPRDTKKYFWGSSVE